MSKTKKTTILIADDHAMVRDGLAAVIGFQPDLELVGEAQDGVEAVEACRRLSPDVALVDLIMPRLNGAGAVAGIRAASPDTKILVITSYADAADLSTAFENGATGAISKTSSKETLFDAIRRTALGESVVSREFKASLRESRESAPRLSDRQRGILESLARGLTNADIARQHGISESNVKFHLLTIFRKLNVANRAEAVATAMKKHLI